MLMRRNLLLRGVRLVVLCGTYAHRRYPSRLCNSHRAKGVYLASYMSTPVLLVYRHRENISLLVMLMLLLVKVLVSL